jgi:hypothetical protein
MSNPDDFAYKILQELKQKRPNIFMEKLNRNDRSSIMKDFSAHGLAWVERFVNACLPSARVYPPMAASLLYGEYFHEFDVWRSARKFNSLQSFQGVLLNTSDHGTSLLRIENCQGLSSWYGRTFEGHNVSILCVDPGLVALAGYSFYHFMSGMSSDGALRRWLLSTGSGSLDESTGYLSAAESEVVAEAREIFRAGARSLLEFFGLSKATKALGLFISEGHAESQIASWMQNYCESMTLHFLLGHEFGHYAYRESKGILTTQIRGLSESLIYEETPRGELLEEIFCDLMGLDNCLFQTFKFEVPPIFVIYVPIWLLACLRAVSQSKTDGAERALSLASRGDALARFWTNPGLQGRYPGIAAAAAVANAALSPVAALFAAHLAKLDHRFRFPFALD